MMAWLASSAAILLPFVIGIASSVRAIETPGGADDRQWLTFWMVFVLFSVAEHFTDVLISRMPLCAQFSAQSRREFSRRAILGAQVSARNSSDAPLLRSIPGTTR